MKTEAQVLSTLAKYCSLTERSLYDVQKKIKAANLPKDAEKRITDRLLKEKYIDEERFIRSFVNDKFKFNHWGRIKISYELKMKNIRPEAYNNILESIDEEAYFSVLTDLLKKKLQSIKGASPQDSYQKLFRFAASKGFETQLITIALKDIIKNFNDE